MRINCKKTSQLKTVLHFNLIRHWQDLDDQFSLVLHLPPTKMANGLSLIWHKKKEYLFLEFSLCFWSIRKLLSLYLFLREGTTFSKTPTCPIDWKMTIFKFNFYNFVTDKTRVFAQILEWRETMSSNTKICLTTIQFNIRKGRNEIIKVYLSGL